MDSWFWSSSSPTTNTTPKQKPTAATPFTTASSSEGECTTPTPAQPSSSPSTDAPSSSYHNTPNTSSTARLDPLTESTLPTTLACTPLFDAAHFCTSLGGQLRSIYHVGTLRDCSPLWRRFWFCMRTRTRTRSLFPLHQNQDDHEHEHENEHEDEHDYDERTETVREYQRGLLREKYYDGRNWIVDGDGPDASTANTQITQNTITDSENANTYGDTRSNAQITSYADKNGSVDMVSKDKSVGSKAKAKGTTGKPKPRCRSSEEVWQLRTEKVARAFDLDPERDEVFELDGRRYRRDEIEALERKIRERGEGR